ncbi:MAG: hypothetical protein P857_409 [Candidatus Xenolissoclinum pacificiensis L6]|uniref:Uncharacterized protein n=1 Tax=Candidatus Xenolissoclinum pacificiensis L6 TaxID=1401685 RepID=W2UZL3_9RICK|nr:MAG: hypothetical protein P857_409 [Candidatus Xenolissoclinum pacificiensis L6]
MLRILSLTAESSYTICLSGLFKIMNYYILNVGIMIDDVRTILSCVEELWDNPIYNN